MTAFSGSRREGWLVGTGDDVQAGDAGEVGVVVGCDSEAVCDGGGGDPEVVRADQLAALGESGPDVGVDARDGFGDWNGLEAGE